MYKLTGSVHKGTSANSHLGHNRRSVPVPHCDKSRSHLNEVFRDIPIEEAYQILFDDALKEYNQGKKPSRQIPDYFEHIIRLYNDGEKKLQEARLQGATRKRQATISSTYQKPYYELIVSLGNIDSYDGKFRNGGELENLSLETLREYISSFEERNPNLFVFGAYLHRDESGVPHLHIDYIPWSDEPKSRGLQKRLTESGAFKQMGLCSGDKIGTIAFQEREREVISEIARKHGIEIVEGKHTRKHLDKEEYILEREQEKVGIASHKVNEGAKALLKRQEDIARFMKDTKEGRLYSDILSMREQNKQYVAMLSDDAVRLKDCWDDFNRSTGDFFVRYRKQKSELFAEIHKARSEQKANTEKINALISSIIFDFDFLIVKVVKLFSLFRHFIKGKTLENEIDRLQNENRQMKETAKEIMGMSKDVGDVLRNREYDKMTETIERYETALSSAIGAINNITDVDRDNGER